MPKRSQLDELRAEGRLVARGEFQLDRAEAREKMKDYQLSDPHEYVLEFIEAAHLLGAKAVDLHCEPAAMEVAFDGVSLSANELNGLYDAVFTAGDDARSRGLAQLALGMVNAESLEPVELRVELQRAGQISTLDLMASSEFAKTELLPNAPETLRTRLREPFRLRHVARSFGHGLGMYPRREASIVRKHCAFAEMPVWIDGERVDKGLSPPSTIDNWIEFELPHERGALGIVWGTTEAVFDVVVRGVLRGQYRFDVPIGARGVIASERIEQNLSRTGFVQNEDWKAITDFLLVAAYHKAAFHYVENRSMSDEQPDWLLELACHPKLHLRRHSRKELLRIQRANKFEFLINATVELAQRLRRAKIWPLAHAHWNRRAVSLDEMLYRTRRHQREEVYYSKRKLLANRSFDAPLILLFPYGPPDALVELFDGRFVDIDAA